MKDLRQFRLAADIEGGVWVVCPHCPPAKREVEVKTLDDAYQWAINHECDKGDKSV